MSGECGRIAEDDELHACSGDGYIHTAQVAQKAYLSLVVGTHHRDKDDVAFLPLEPVDGIHRNEMTVGLEELASLDELPQILHLVKEHKHKPSTHLITMLLLHTLTKKSKDQSFNTLLTNKVTP